MTLNLQTQSPLFKLSGELRNRIYEQVSIDHPNNHEPSLFATCNQIRSEGLKLFYATHTFLFPAKQLEPSEKQPTAYHHLLTSVAAEKAERIEHLRFQVQNQERYFTNPDAEAIFVDIKIHAGRAEVVSAGFSPPGVSQKATEKLEKARRDLNAAWKAHENPTKVGLLRTLLALVPQEVRMEGERDRGLQ